MSTEKKINRTRIILNLLVCGDRIFFRFFACFIAINFLFTIPSEAKSSTTKSEKAAAVQIQPQERKWLEKFFKDIMLRENGIYTLFGSKPMSSIVLDLRSQEEIQALIDQMPEEDKRDMLVIDEDYDLPENWKKWEEIKDRFPLSNYLFVKMKREDNPKFEDIYLINIRQTAFTIDENYDVFRKYVGEDFDSLDVVFEIGSDESDFWKETMHNSTLLGILFGYGKKNAQCFDWKYWIFPDRKEPVKSFVDSLKSNFPHEPRTLKNVSIKNFSLPCFASFSPPGEDEVIHKYERERKRIQKAYSGKDFLDETLRLLTSK